MAQADARRLKIATKIRAAGHTPQSIIWLAWTAYMRSDAALPLHPFDLPLSNGMVVEVEPCDIVAGRIDYVAHVQGIESVTVTCLKYFQRPIVYL